MLAEPILEDLVQVMANGGTMLLFALKCHIHGISQLTKTQEDPETYTVLSNRNQTKIIGTQNTGTLLLDMAFPEAGREARVLSTVTLSSTAEIVKPGMEFKRCANSTENIGDTVQKEMTPGKKSPVLVDGVVLNGPQTDVKAGEKFVEEACRLVMEEVVLKATDINEKVCEWQPPEQLRQLLDLEMRDTGEPQDKLLKLCQDVIHFSVKTNHPRFFNQLYAGLDYYSLAARIITEALNPSIYTYEVSPVFLLVEEAVLKKMIECVGWKEGDGIFNPGGSVSNMCAMNLARYRYYPDVKEKGLSGLPRLILFASTECHYSMKKAASFLGIGTQNVYFVETDGRGKMIPEELEKRIWQAREEGAVPFLVCATSGTTVLGAFDPLDEIAEVCERHALWLHVDASWGGSALVSRKHRQLLHGIHRADSVAWNPHKMLMAGIQCSALLIKDKSSRSPAHEMVPLTVKVELPISANLI
ncbi:hypothetical protein STEG23_032716 [Scotinomys teguina]